MLAGTGHSNQHSTLVSQQRKRQAGTRTRNHNVLGVQCSVVDWAVGWGGRSHEQESSKTLVSAQFNQVADNNLLKLSLVLRETFQRALGPILWVPRSLYSFLYHALSTFIQSLAAKLTCVNLHKLPLYAPLPCWVASRGCTKRLQLSW